MQWHVLDGAMQPTQLGIIASGKRFPRRQHARSNIDGIDTVHRLH
jgi:hypothetical protein